MLGEANELIEPRDVMFEDYELKTNSNTIVKVGKLVAQTIY